MMHYLARMLFATLFTCDERSGDGGSR